MSCLLLVTLAGCAPAAEVPGSAEPAKITAGKSADPAPSVAPSTSPSPSALPSASAAPSVPESGSPRSVDPARLHAFIERARELGTDQLLLWQAGKTLGQLNADGPPLQTMSITKSVLSLAVLRLVALGKLTLETRVASLFPEWNTEGKRDVQVLHLLSHTSGIEEPKTLWLYRNQDFVKFALNSKLVAKPGEKFSYGNNACNLLSGVIAKASGQRTDRFVAQELFRPLGIQRFWWSLDRAKNAHGLAGLHLNADGLLRLGQLVLAEGRLPKAPPAADSGATDLLPTELLQKATGQAGPIQPNHKRVAWLWWLAPEWTQLELTRTDIAAWQRAGVDPGFLQQMQPLLGRKFQSAEAYRAAVKQLRPEDPELKLWDELTWQAGLPDVSYSFGAPVGSYAAGSLGQYLVILPRDQLIAVRLRKAPKQRRASAAGPDPNDFQGFVDAVRGLVEPRP